MRHIASFVPMLFAFLFLLSSGTASAMEEKTDGAQPPPLSTQTQACIACHRIYTPGIVQDWSTSRHSKMKPGDAMEKSPRERRISAERLPEELRSHAVGCYECHSRNPDVHKDNFAHMGYKINVVVTPDDCKTCHPVEAEQFSGSKKSLAFKNLMGNPVYRTLVETITGRRSAHGAKLSAVTPTEDTLRETCLGCHGTRVEVKGTKTVNVKIGSVVIPDLANWPNQGVGRINPDGSAGACTACHPRHGFLIEVARKPYTCSQCHHEPDVPAWNVYEESKHGNIYSSKGKTWDFTSVPWKLGKDFTAPTCAVCHNSLLVSPEGEMIAERSHNFGSRLWVRLFGLIYSHAQPKSGDTTIIRNKDGLPLPTTFGGDLASDYLIDRAEQEERRNTLSRVCNGCHNTEWIRGHFAKLESTLRETDEMILASTELISNAWDRKIEDKTNPFDESIEQMWIGQWLFYSNSIRYASAMTGAPDYAAFKNGWWHLNENLQHMRDWMELKRMKGEKEDKDS